MNKSCIGFIRMPGGSDSIHFDLQDRLSSGISKRSFRYRSLLVAILIARRAPSVVAIFSFYGGIPDFLNRLVVWSRGSRATNIFLSKILTGIRAIEHSRSRTKCSFEGIRPPKILSYTIRSVTIIGCNVPGPSAV